MKRADRIVQAPGRGFALLRRATSPDEVGRSLEPGVMVETDLETALACGAWFEDAEAAEEAFEATEDPSDFQWGKGRGDGKG